MAKDQKLSRAELEAKTKDELSEIAVAKGLELKSTALKSEIVDAILAHDAEPEAAKPGGETVADAAKTTDQDSVKDAAKIVPGAGVASRADVEADRPMAEPRTTDAPIVSASTTVITEVPPRVDSGTGPHSVMLKLPDREGKHHIVRGHVANLDFDDAGIARGATDEDLAYLKERFGEEAVVIVTD